MNPIFFRFDNERFGFELCNRFADISLHFYSSIRRHIDIIKRKVTCPSADLTCSVINLNIPFPLRIGRSDYIKNDDYLKEKFSLESHLDIDANGRHLFKIYQKMTIRRVT